MSTRRTTRASSRGLSPTPSLPNNATPRRSNRRVNDALPPVGVRQSTAYGDNTMARPSNINGPVVSDQLNNVLRDLLPPASKTQIEPETPASSVGNRSFGLESGLFGGAQVESSMLDNSSLRLPPLDEDSDDDAGYYLPPKPIPQPSRTQNNAAAKRRTIDELAAQRLNPPNVPPPSSTLRDKILNNINDLVNFLRSIVLWLTWVVTSVISRIFCLETVPWVLFTLFIWVLYSAFRHGGDATKIMSDWPVLGSYSPFKGSEPSFQFVNDDTLRGINRRLGDLEVQVTRTKHHLTDMDTKVVERLDAILPDLLSVKKDRYGNVIIPDDFWTALQDKIRSDDSLVHEPMKSGSPDSSHGISGKELNREVERLAKSAWDKYMKQNNINTKSLVTEEVSNRFPKMLAESHIVTKQEVIGLIQKKWEENKETNTNLKIELAQIDKKFEAVSRQISKFQNSPGSLTKEEVRNIAFRAIKDLIPNGQLDALAKASLRNSVDSSLAKVNYFSRYHGATIDHANTAPVYVPPKNDVNPFQRMIRKALNNPIPKPNSAATALERWQEFGDCWCAKATDELGSGPNLAVITGKEIFAEQVIVEHIPQTATLDPGSAPRDMELLIWVPELENYNQLMHVSTQLFPDEPELTAPYRYVRVGTWTYDIEGDISQPFDMQIDLKSLGISANKFIIRAHNNWGHDTPFTCFYRIKVHGDVAPVRSEVVD